MDVQEVARQTKRRILARMAALSGEELICRVRAQEQGLPHPLERAFSRDRLQVIGSIRCASPQKSAGCSAAACAAAYRQSGVSAIRVDTEPLYGNGRDADLQTLRGVTAMPLIRRDFILTAYQIYESRYLGADAVELMGMMLKTDRLRELLSLTDSLNMSAIVHVYSEPTLQLALEAGARMLCLDTVHPRTGQWDEENVARLCPQAPKDAVILTERVTETPENLAALRRLGVRAVFLGDRFTRARSKTSYLRRLGVLPAGE